MVDGTCRRLPKALPQTPCGKALVPRTISVVPPIQQFHSIFAFVHKQKQIALLEPFTSSFGSHFVSLLRLARTKTSLDKVSQLTLTGHTCGVVTSKKESNKENSLGLKNYLIFCFLLFRLSHVLFLMRV